MKAISFLVSAFLTVVITSTRGQGTIVFDNQVDPHGTDYYELGMAFNVIIPTSGAGGYHDGMVIEPANTFANLPSNSTPYMIFLRQFSPDDYVVVSMTTGNTFGLRSVDLADPNSPSSSAVPITFKGYTAGGLVVSQTFTTPGNGASSFLHYQFNPSFASGLLSVDILSTRWAMDNLVFTVPEPAGGSLLSLGLLALAARRRAFKRCAS